MLTKSVSCFDPVLNQDLVFNGTNMSGAFRQLQRPDHSKIRKSSDGNHGQTL